MSFLNPKSRNRKRRGGKKTSAEKVSNTWIHTDSTPAAKSQTLKQSHHKLNAKIGALEDFLAGHALAEAHKNQMRRDNILPPPESLNHQQARRRMSAIERRRYLAERNRGGIKFFSLFCIASAIGWWLLKNGL